MRRNGYKWLLKFIFVVVAGMVLTSCFKTKLDSISDNLTWSPNLSIPVGAVIFSIPQKDADNVDIGDFYTPPLKLWYDTLEFDISGMITYREPVKSVMFRINMYNEFPAQSEILIFYPEDGQGVDYSRSLTGSDPIEITAGKIDIKGKVTIPSRKQVDIVLTDNQIDDLMTSSHLILRTVVRNMYVTEGIKNNLTQYRFITKIGTQVQIVKIYE